MSDPIRKRLDEIKSALDIRNKMMSRELELKWHEFDTLTGKLASESEFLLEALEIAMEGLEELRFDEDPAADALKRIRKLAAEGSGE